MQADEKTLTLSKSLWVQYGGVDVAEQGELLMLTGRDEDAFLKVFNHFGRVLKLYTFEDGRWLDADTGGPAQPFDESQAGRLPAAAGASESAPPPRAARKAAPARRASGKPAARKTAAAQPAGRKAARSKAPAKAKHTAPARASRPKAASGKAPAKAKTAATAARPVRKAASARKAAKTRAGTRSGTRG